MTLDNAPADEVLREGACRRAAWVQVRHGGRSRWCRVLVIIEEVGRPLAVRVRIDLFASDVGVGEVERLAFRA